MAYTPFDFSSGDWEQRGFLACLDYWVDHQGELPAITFGAVSLTYAEVAKLVRTFAAGLAARGITPGAKVAIATSRSEALIPLLLAVWSLRAAYVPVDPTYPVARQLYILENAEVDVLVADGQRNDLGFAGTSVALKDLYNGLAPAQPLANVSYDPADLAYMIYTSGSTGNPKGVAISQSNLMNFLLAMVAEPGLQAQDRLLAITTISFDIHILELFLPLLVGCRVIVASKQEAVTPELLQAIIDRHAISVLQATPATWRMLLGQGWRPRQPLKILVGGEALPTDLRPLMHAASRELWNMYGPTETTVGVMIGVLGIGR